MFMKIKIKSTLKDYQVEEDLYDVRRGEPEIDLCSYRESRVHINNRVSSTLVLFFYVTFIHI